MLTSGIFFILLALAPLEWTSKLDSRGNLVPKTPADYELEIKELRSCFVKEFDPIKCFSTAPTVAIPRAVSLAAAFSNLRLDPVE